jgi:hypothetical protein
MGIAGIVTNQFPYPLQGLFPFAFPMDGLKRLGRDSQRIADCYPDPGFPEIFTQFSHKPTPIYTIGKRNCGV